MTTTTPTRNAQNLHDTYNAIFRQSKVMIDVLARKVAGVSGRRVCPDDVRQEFALKLWSVLPENIGEIENAKLWSRGVIRNLSKDLMRKYGSSSDAEVSPHTDDDDSVMEWVMEPVEREEERLSTKLLWVQILERLDTKIAGARNSSEERRFRALREYFDPSDELVASASKRAVVSSKVIESLQAQGWRRRSLHNSGHEHLDLEDLLSATGIGEGTFDRALRAFVKEIKSDMEV